MQILSWERLVEDSQCCVPMYAHGQFSDAALAAGETEMCLWADRSTNDLNTLDKSYRTGESYHVAPLLSTLKLLPHRFSIKSKSFTVATSVYVIWPLPASLISYPVPPILSLSSATMASLLFHKHGHLLLASVPRLLHSFPLSKKTLFLQD